MPEDREDANQVWNRGYESLIAFRGTVAADRDVSIRDVAKTKLELSRAEEKARQNELRLKTVDEMLEAYIGTRTSSEGTPPLVGMGRFTGVDLKTALATMFEEFPGIWFSVPTLQEKLISQGFDAKIAHLNPAIHAACKRFLEKDYLETQEGKEGRVYRYRNGLERLRETLELAGAIAPHPSNPTNQEDAE